MRTKPTLLVLVISLVAACAFASAAPAAKPKAKVTPNTGKPGSPCRPVAFGGMVPSPDPSLDTTSLGSRAPAAYEIGNATNSADKDGPPKRVMMFIHGGAWYVVGREALEVERSLAATWRAAGWQTVSITYRGCNKSVADSTRMYDLVRERVGPNVPICIFGQSAGGHLALMIAARRADVACVVSLAGPSDLRSAQGQGKAESASGAGPAKLGEGSAWGTGLAKAAFGKKNLKKASPITRARWIFSRLLLATAKDDVVVPGGQDYNLAARIAKVHPGAYVDTARPNPGSNPFIHGTADQASMDEMREKLRTLVAPFGSAPAEPKADSGSGFELPWPLNGFSKLFKRFGR